jgi:hypothetical protein
MKMSKMSVQKPRNVSFNELKEVKKYELTNEEIRFKRGETIFQDMDLKKYSPVDDERLKAKSFILSVK